MDEAEAAPHLLFKNTPNNRTEQMDSFLQSMPPDEFRSLMPNTENPCLEGDTINIMCLHMVKELNMEDSVFFWDSCLTQSAAANLYSNTKFTSPVKTAKQMELLNKDAILVAISDSKGSQSSHWMLGVIAFKPKEIVLFDSLNTSLVNRDHEFRTLTYITETAYVAAAKPFKLEEWKHIYAETPQHKAMESTVESMSV